MSGTRFIWIFIAATQMQLISGSFMSSCTSTTMGCYPSSCTQDSCTFQLIWTEESDYVHFMMTYVISEASEGDQWAAVGYSKDNQMADTSIVMCRSEGGSTSVETGYTMGNTYMSLTTNNVITDEAVNHTGNTLICSFKRMKFPTEEPDKNLFLNETIWLLHAHGNIASGTPMQHAVSDRAVSMTTVNFLPSTIETTTASSAIVFTTSQFCFLLSLLICTLF